MAAEKNERPIKVVAENRKARFNYAIEDTIETARALAESLRSAGDALASLFSGQVLLELAPEFQSDQAALSLLYFKATPAQGGAAAAGAAERAAATTTAGGNAGGGNPGIVVPLDTLAKATQVIGPQTVNHYGQLPAVTISSAATSSMPNVRPPIVHCIPANESGTRLTGASVFGGVGMGNAFKLIYNVMGAVQVAALAEGMFACEAAGIDLSAAAEGFSIGYTGSRHVSEHSARMAEGKRNQPVGFAGSGRLKGNRAEA